MRSACLFIFLLAFASLPSDVKWARAQQPDDDPNWRERQLEKMQAEIDKLEKELKVLQEKHDAAKAEMEGLRNKMQPSPWLDRWDSRPIFPKLLQQALQNTRRSIWLDREDYGPRLASHKI